MNLDEFYYRAVGIAKKYNRSEQHVNVHASHSHSGKWYSCNVFDLGSRKSIEASGFKNPEAALQAFDDNINHFLQEYSKDAETIDL